MPRIGGHDGKLLRRIRDRWPDICRRMSTPTAQHASFDVAVARLRQGDEEAFRQVYRAVNPGLLRYLTVLVGSADADDVASETWAQAFRDLDRFRGDGDGFRGWVVTIGRHRALDHLRAKARRPMSSLAIEDLPDRSAGQDPLDTVLEDISTATALRLIGSLPSDQAEAVLLRTVMGLDAKTAGRVLGKRPGAVRTSAHRGLKALAQRLDEAAARPGDQESSGGCNTSESFDADGLR
jgi:RNA polymerase sigma-70 factor (ECF subfamily)